MTQICPSQLGLKEGTGHTRSGAGREGFLEAVGFKQGLEGKVEHIWVERGVFLYIPKYPHFKTPKLKVFFFFLLKVFLLSLSPKQEPPP